MLGVTTIGSHSHVGSQAVGEVRHCLADMFLWQLFSDGLQGDFERISPLKLRLEFVVLPPWCHRRDSLADSSLERLGAAHFSQ